MPRVARRPITGAELASPALVAAATPVKTGNSTKKVAEATGWKKEAWDFYDTVGELSYVCDWLGDALSRARLIASDIADDGRPTGATADTTVASIVADIAGGPAGQSTMLGRLATNLTIVGEAWVTILTRDTDLGSVEEWHILSADEMTTRGSEILLTLGDDTTHVFNPDVDLLTRVHIPHPRNARESAAATRSALEPLRELAGTAASIRGATRSRLAGNGILLLPQEISMPMAAPPTGDPDAPGLPAPEQPVMEDRQVTAQDVMGQLQQVMTMAIQDPSSAAAMVPIILKAPGEHLDKVRHITLESEVTEMSLRTRDSAIRRLALSLKVPPEMLLGLSQGNHWCVDTETEIMTRRGWKTLGELSLDDEVMTMNHETGRSEWQHLEDVHTFQVEDEPMMRMQSRTHSSLTTLNHKWATVTGSGVRKWKTSANLASSDRIPTGIPNSELPDVPSVSDSVVELAAWFATDACLSDGRLSLFQSHTRNPDRVDSIRAALDKEFAGQYRERVQRAREDTFGGDITVFVLRKEARDRLTRLVGSHPGDKERIVSPAFVDSLTHSQLMLFLNTYQRADGRHYRQGVLDVWMKNPRQLDAYERAAILAGYATSRREDMGGWSVSALKSTRVNPVKAAEESRRIGSDGAIREVVEYTGTVWCPQTPNRTWLARRDGKTFYTGNSAWAIDASAVNTHVVPMLTVICDALTDAVLRPLLARAGHKDPNAVTIWFDVSDLANGASRTENAVAAFDRGAISAVTLRQSLGFGDDDAPSDEMSDSEKRALAIQMVSKAPSLLPMLAPILGLDIDSTVGPVAGAPVAQAPVAPPAPPKGA